MKHLYSVTLNVLIFFFIVEVFSSIFRINNDTLGNKLILSLVYAAVVWAAPNVIIFFKLKVADWLLIITTAALLALYFFIGKYLLDLWEIPRTIFNPGVDFFNPVNLGEESVVLGLISLAGAVLSVGIPLLNKKKKISARE